MKSWQHNIYKILPNYKGSYYLITGETLNEHDFKTIEWSYVVDSKGMLVESIPSNRLNHYKDTNLNKCIKRYLNVGKQVFLYLVHLNIRLCIMSQRMDVSGENSRRMISMISFIVYSKQENRDSEHIFSREEEGGKANALRSAVAQEFADYIIDGNKENQPFIYITLVPIREKGGITAASIVSSDLCFKSEVREELLNFIQKY